MTIQEMEEAIDAHGREPATTGYGADAPLAAVDEEDSYQKWGFPRSLLKFNLLALAPVSDTGDAGGVVSALRQTQGRNGVKLF